MIHKTLAIRKKKRQKLINIYAIICTVGVVLSIIPDIYFGLWRSALSTLSIVIFFGMVLYLNQYKPQLAARLLIIVITIFIVMFSFLLGKAANVHLTLILVIVANQFILDSQKKLEVYLHIIHPSLFYLLLELTSYQLPFLPRFENITPAQIEIFGIVNLLIVFCFLPLVSIVIFQTNYKATQEISQINQQLQKQNEELSKINEELDQFAYRVSHDLRSPLNSMKGIISILEDIKNEEELQMYHQLMRKSVDKLDNFIGDVLDHSLNARAELKIEAIDLERFIKEVFEQLKYEALEKNVQFDLEILGQETAFASDSRRLRIVLHNLISNAIRYSDNRKPQPFIRICVTIEPHKVEIVMQDNGLGIEKEHLDKVFQMFYRAHTSIAGTGLGLYLVKECVDKLNGTIDLESEIDKGTTFRLVLENQWAKLNET